MKLLPEELLLKTGSLDQARWNYRGLLRSVQLSRFEAACTMLGEKKYQHLLEIGYGSGIFMPELAQRCHRLSGVDVHDRSQQVAACLEEIGVSADLHQASATCLPFGEGQVDCVVSISALEFVDDLDGLACELSRVLTPDGKLVVICPVKSWATDLALLVLKGQRARDYYGQGREQLYPALSCHFTCVKQFCLPITTAWAGIRAYNVWSFAPRQGGN